MKESAEREHAERLLAWNALGVSLAAHGRHRFALAMHIVEVNACGALGVRERSLSPSIVVEVRPAEHRRRGTPG